jgi:HAD superfamily hydrolase (TIGR01457 family)
VALLDRYDCFLFDLDGVLYRGAESIAEAPEALRAIREAGKRVAFVTNNSARTPRAVAERLRSVGVAADDGEVETSAMATAALLGRRGIGTAFVVGEEGVRSALTDSGIAVLDGEPERADVVVVGFDTTADYAKLRTASVLVQRGAALVATNGDGSFPAADGTRWPGAGALLAAIVATTDVEPEVVGKPNAPLYLAALERAGGGRPLVVGDRLDTDIAGAVSLGWDSLLVLTGISTRDEADASPIRPTFVADDLSILMR